MNSFAAFIIRLPELESSLVILDSKVQATIFYQLQSDDKFITFPQESMSQPY